MRLNLKDILMPAVALFVICLVAALLLASTNALTADRIAENVVRQELESRMVAFPSASGFVDENVVSVGDKAVKFCKAVDENGTTLGYVLNSSARGYGGAVSVMTAIDMTGKVVKTVVLSMDDETPGLGQNAGKNDFLGQFTGKNGPFEWVKNHGEGNSIAGVTSATFTSEAVIECVNDCVKGFRIITGGEQNG